MVPGDKVGPYQLRASFTEEGEAEIWQAFDPKRNKQVVLKLLPPRLAQSSLAKEALEREAFALGHLSSHPKIVRLLDLKFSRKQGPYLVLEPLFGITLRERLQQIFPKPMEIEEFSEAALSLCEVLSWVHRAGIIHGDIKASNIILLPYPPYLKLIDFGLSALPKQNSTPISLPLGTGTPGHMPPEHLTGDTLSTASDIFSVGVLFWEMLTQIKAERRRTESFAVDSFLLKTPEEIRRIVLGCLEPNPNERYQSVGKLQKDLAQALLKSIKASPDSLPSSTPFQVRKKRPVRSILKASSFVLLGGLLGVYLSQSSIIPRKTSQHGSTPTSELNVAKEPASLVSETETDVPNSPDKRIHLQPVDSSFSPSQKNPAVDKPLPTVEEKEGNIVADEVKEDEMAEVQKDKQATNKTTPGWIKPEYTDKIGKEPIPLHAKTPSTKPTSKKKYRLGIEPAPLGYLETRENESTPAEKEEANVAP